MPAPAPPPAGTARPARTEAEVRVDLAAAYRLAALNGWDDTDCRHLAASVPGEPGICLINEFGLGFDEISASRLVKVDVRGQGVDGSARPVNPTGFAILVPAEAMAALTHRQWVGDGREWDGDVAWPALLRRVDRLSTGYRD